MTPVIQLSLPHNIKEAHNDGERDTYTTPQSALNSTPNRRAMRNPQIAFALTKVMQQTPIASQFLLIPKALQLILIARINRVLRAMRLSTLDNSVRHPYQLWPTTNTTRSANEWREADNEKDSDAHQGFSAGIKTWQNASLSTLDKVINRAMLQPISFLPHARAHLTCEVLGVAGLTSIMIRPAR